MTRRNYSAKEYDKILDIFLKGGILYFIENEKGELYYEHLHFENPSPRLDEITGWADKMHSVVAIQGAFLTREDAEKVNNFTEGGCRCCGNNAIKIPTIVTEYEFLNTNNPIQ